MSAFQHGRNAARAGEAEIDRARLDDVRCGAVIGIGEPRAHRAAERRIAFLLRPVLEIATVCRVQHRLETVRLERLQRVGKLVDGIVGTRTRAVAAFVVGGQEIGLESLLGDRDLAAQGSELLVIGWAATISVETEFGVGQVAPLGRPERRADSARFLVAAIEEDDVAVGLEPLAHQLDRGHGRSDVAILHVGRAATEEVAVLLAEHERVELPVLALCFDDIHVAEDEHRLLGRMRRAPAHDQRFGLIAGQRFVGHEVDVAVGDPGGSELTGEQLRDAGHLATIVDARNLDRLLEHVASLGLPSGLQLGRKCPRVGGREGGSRTKCQNESCKSAHRRESSHAILLTSTPRQTGVKPFVSKTIFRQDLAASAASGRRCRKAIAPAAARPCRAPDYRSE